MTFSDACFWVFAATAVLPALGILVVRNFVRMAFLLLFSLAGFAGLYLHLGAGFVGFTQVLVYIGGILILFLFGVMLTAKVDHAVREKPRSGLLVPSVVVALVFLGSLTAALLAYPWHAAEPSTAVTEPQAAELGLRLMSHYVLPFEAVSMLLLVAMVGSAFVARGGSGRHGAEPQRAAPGDSSHPGDG